MYLGLDIGTSAIKAIVTDDEQAVVADASVPLPISRPKPLWSEQNPEDWWDGACAAVMKLGEIRPDVLGLIQGIGLSGQMHGAVLLDANSRVLRPAILWNDGRSSTQCDELTQQVENLSTITGNLAMPGFTAPKLLWVKQNEPDYYRRTAKVLLPKDYIRYRLTGEFVSDMSDSAGTLWMNVGEREWSDSMLQACGLTRAHMPSLIEGNDISGVLQNGVSEQLGLPGQIPVAGGGGDNACGAVGIGTVAPGRAFLSLGTSGVLFVSTERYTPHPERGVHTFCHALPATWHQMGVLLSASSCLSWVTGITNARDEASLLKETQEADHGPATEIFLPYLSGERTPHNNPYASGVFYGLNHETDRPRLARAVLDGVAFAFADAQQALVESGTEITEVSVIGGGARSLFWGEILASALDRPLNFHAGAEYGPAYGAARLARLAVTGEAVNAVCNPPPIAQVIEPNLRLVDQYQEQMEQFRALYRNLEKSFSV